MKSAVLASIILIVGVATARAAMIDIPDGTVAANTPINGTYAGAVTSATTLDAQAEPIMISGSITGVSSADWTYLQVGLLPQSSWNPSTGAWGYGVFGVTYEEPNNKLAMSFESRSLGDPTVTKGPFLEGMSYPTAAAPLRFTITLTPNGASGGTATAAIVGQTLQGSGTSYAYNGDYSNALLVIQFLSFTQGATASFEDITASPLPEPASVALVLCGVAALKPRRRPAP